MARRSRGLSEDRSGWQPEPAARLAVLQRLQVVVLGDHLQRHHRHDAHCDHASDHNDDESHKEDGFPRRPLFSSPVQDKPVEAIVCSVSD